jgi:hypothetical protein
VIELGRNYGSGTGPLNWNTIKTMFIKNVHAALLHIKHNLAKETKEISVSGPSYAHRELHHKPSSLESEFNVSFGR